MRHSALILASLLLAACGTKGGLTLPPKPDTAASSPATAADASTKPEADR